MVIQFRVCIGAHMLTHNVALRAGALPHRRAQPFRTGIYVTQGPGAYHLDLKKQNACQIPKQQA